MTEKKRFPEGIYSQKPHYIHYTLNRGGDRLHKHLSQQIGAKSVQTSQQPVAPMPLQFAKEVMKDAQIGKQSLGRDENWWH